MDGPFSVFPILSVYLFYVARERETLPDQKWYEFRPYSLLTGLSLALGMFMTYSTVVVGVFLCVVALLERQRFVQYLKVLLFASSGFIGFYLLLFVLTGFRPIEALWAAIKKDETGMGSGYESIERYLHLSFANLFAFLIGVGLPITTVYLRQLVAAIREWRQNALASEQGIGEPRTPWLLRHENLDTFIIGFLITLLYFTFSTWFTMEVERIWIFMVPFFCYSGRQTPHSAPNVRSLLGRRDTRYAAHRGRSPALHVLVAEESSVVSFQFGFSAKNLSVLTHQLRFP